jgi:hypothetical protein
MASGKGAKIAYCHHTRTALTAIPGGDDHSKYDQRSDACDNTGDDTFYIGHGLARSGRFGLVWPVWSWLASVIAGQLTS